MAVEGRFPGSVLQIVPGIESSPGAESKQRQEVKVPGERTSKWLWRAVSPGAHFKQRQELKVPRERSPNSAGK